MIMHRHIGTEECDIVLLIDDVHNVLVRCVFNVFRSVGVTEIGR